MGELTIGDIVSGVMTTLRQRFLLLLGMLLVFLVLQIVMIGAFGYALMPDIDPANSAPASSGGGAVLLQLVMMVFSVWSNGATNHAASPLVKSDFVSSMGAGIRAVPTLIGTVILLWIACLVLVVAVSIVFALLAMASRGLAILLAIPLLVGLSYVVSRLCIITPVVVVDGERNPITAISRSWNLTAGNAGTIFGAVLLFTLGSGILFVIAFIPLIRQLAAIDRDPSALLNRMDSLSGLAGTLSLGVVVGLIVWLVWSALIPVIHAQLAGPSAQDQSDVFS